ncbi:MAG: hypothetical protein QGH51_04500 [Planctomycetota bacterium]|jgi:nitrate reductase NapAB chaperone NapD|nr:hypothetical protein [Planctomycetota bacterium]MDP6941271.1 hypothetical protein [Planctomycetota bacterium]
MAIVGAFARIEPGLQKRAEVALTAIQGVSTFELEDSSKLGILVETDSLESAHEIIRYQIESIDGVLGVWPSYANIEDEVEEVQPTNNHES